MIPRIIALVILITLSCIFSISESSFLGLNKLRLKILKDKNDKRALRVGKLLEKRDKLINTLLVSNDLVNIFISSIITAIALSLFGEKGVGIATVTATVLLLIFGEITPKTISTRRPDKIAFTLAPLVQVVVWIMRPLVFIVTNIARLILKLFGINTAKKKQSYTEEDIKTFFDIGEEAGVLEESENDMMSKVFKFTDLEAQDIMVPRTKIRAVRESISYKDLIELCQRTGFSRFPVYKDSIDDITGIIYLKDLLAYKTAPETYSTAKVMRAPLFIPGTKNISAIQSDLSENRQSMAIVVDEYSGTDGIVTTEDIAREIFGTSKDSSMRGKVFDFDEVEDQNNFEINGSVLLRDLQESLHIELNSEINETIGGWIAEKLDRMPLTSDVVDFEGWSFIVKKIQAHRVERLQIIRMNAEEDGDMEDEE